jgi:hypothetical protein
MILCTLRTFNDLYQIANYLELPNPVTGDQLGAMNDRQPCRPAVVIIPVAEKAERFSNFEKWNHAERLIGSIRRDNLGRVTIFGKQHLRHLLCCRRYRGDLRFSIAPGKHVQLCLNLTPRRACCFGASSPIVDP